MNDTNSTDDHANRDPITGAPGAHPVGVGVGAAAGGMAAGAAAGTLAAGPVGTVIGAAVGAVVGGLGGKVVAEKIDPTMADDYWRQHHAKQSYYSEGREYDEYEPAYRLGSQDRSVGMYANKSFDDVEPHLERDYEAVRGESHAPWSDAKHAVRAAWNRLGEAV